MNTAPETSSPSQTAIPQPADPQPSTARRRPKGKIPSLTKEQRDAINHLLLDGATYAVVEARMAEQGISLNGENISNWYHTGYQEYLDQLDRLDYQRARYEAASDLLQNTDTAKLPEAGLQVAAAQIYDLLGRFTPAALAKAFTDDPDKYTRLLNALSRITRESLTIQKYRDASARAREALKPMMNPNRKLNDEETRAIVRKVDEILGFPTDDDDEFEDPQVKAPDDSSIQAPKTIAATSPQTEPPFTTAA